MSKQCYSIILGSGRALIVQGPGAETADFKWQLPSAEVWPLANGGLLLGEGIMVRQEACQIFQASRDNHCWVWSTRQRKAPDSQPCLRPVALSFVHYLDIVAFCTNARSVCPQVLQLCLPSLRWERLEKTHICIERTQTLLSIFKWYSSTDDIALYCIRLSRGDTMYMRRYVQIICKFYATFPKGPNIWRFCCWRDSGYTYSLVDTDGGQRLVLDPSLFAMV